MRHDRRPLPDRVLAELAAMPQVQQAVRRLALDIRNDARQLAPRSTGTLGGRGVGIEKDRTPGTRGPRWLVGWTGAGWYGWIVEAGHGNEPPRPHLVPAAIKHGAVAPDAGGEG